MKTIVTEVTANPSVRIYHTNVGITEVVLEIPKSAAGNSKWKKFMKPTVGNVLDNILLIDGVVAVRASYYSIDVQIGKAFAWEPIEMTILFELSQLLKGDTGEEVEIAEEEAQIDLMEMLSRGERFKAKIRFDPRPKRERSLQKGKPYSRMFIRNLEGAASHIYKNAQLSPEGVEEIEARDIAMEQPDHIEE